MKHSHTLDIVGNTFEKCSGSRGMIYLDLYNRNSARLLFGDNTFISNFGYTKGGTVHIRTRGPSGIDVYT